ncbi:hypothetical protein DFH08DRAFT_1019788 [Mycena albidolilacea]|uniref:Uncharacterized protein n=1 Tax=Mycena albidolilacea TaxID=1033008 RepID=A0AAD7EK96_9AGAR|nr:hypothetical protein DFH08DRAFT_1019788 [Mycena albidolilacea]
MHRDNSAMVTAVLQAMKLKPPEFFRKAVRHLAVGEDACSMKDAKQLLQLCMGIIDITVDYDFTSPKFLPFIAEMRIERLAMNLKELSEFLSINLAHPLFHFVTHLDIFGFAAIAEVLPDVRLLPALIHLALDRYIPRKNALAVLAECPHLSLAALKWHLSHRNLYQMARTPHIYDVRFVIAVDEEHWGNWLAGTREGDQPTTPHSDSDSSASMDELRHGIARLFSALHTK